MDSIIAVVVILLFVILNSLTYILGAIRTPVGEVFLGTVHWAGDYFYYLSQFAQGADSWFWNFDLYTNDFPAKVLVGWINVFLGHIFQLIRINHLMAYQLSIVIFSGFFLGISYLLIRQIFPEEKSGKSGISKSLVAFILFVISNAFPKFVMTNGRISLSYFDFWFNNGLPFNRLGGVPHHLVSRACVSLIILLALVWWEKIQLNNATCLAGKPAGRQGRQAMKQCNNENLKWEKILFLISFPVFGFILVSAEPIHWMETVLVLFIAPLAYKLYQKYQSRKCNPFDILNPKSKARNQNKCQNIKDPNRKRFGNLDIKNWKLFRYSDFGFLISDKIGLLGYWVIGLFFPSLLLFLGGFPMALYLRKVTSVLPYLQLVVWEASQQLHIDFITFIMGNGPVMVLAIFGCFLFIKKLSLPKMLAIVFSVMTLFLYFSPVPSLAKIVNVRFLPAASTIFFACMATEAIFHLGDRLGKKKNLAVGLLVGFIILVTTPSTVMQLRFRTKPEINNAFFYVNKSVIDTYKTAASISTVQDTFLVIWPFNWTFPGITGRRVYHGHELVTIDYAVKDEMAIKFFDNKMSEKEMAEFLLKNKITYVLTYSWTESVKKLRILRKLQDGGYLALYKVNR